VGVALPLAHLGVHGDVAALGVAEAVPVQEPQTTVFGVFRSVSPVRLVEGVVDREEDGCLVVREGGDLEPGLEEPVGVSRIPAVVLPVHQGELDDAEVLARPAGMTPHLHVKNDGVLLEGDGPVGGIGDVDVLQVLDGLARPDPTGGAPVGGFLGLPVTAPPRGNAKSADGCRNRERHTHGRGPDVAGRLGCEPILLLVVVAFGLVPRVAVRALGRGQRNPVRRHRAGPRAQHADEIPVPGAGRGSGERLALTVPRSEKVAPNVRDESVAHRVGVSGLERLRDFVERMRDGGLGGLGRHAVGPFGRRNRGTEAVGDNRRNNIDC
jgi:hypothetical protein